MRVSVAMATFDGARFLPAQLDSLAAQTVLPTELVVGDDGSTDGTLDVLDAFARRAPFPVHVRRNDARLGFADNFLAAAQRCTGEAIAFSDQDDVWRPGKIERLLAELSRPQVTCVVHRGEIVDTNLRPTGRSVPEIRRDRVLAPFCSDPWLDVPGFALACPRRLLDLADPARRPRSRYSDGPMHHDEWVYFLASACGHTAFVSDALVLYRQHAANTAGEPPFELKVKIARSRAVGAGEYRWRASLASEYADHLDALAAGEPALAERLQRGSRIYRSLAGRLVQRAALHERSASTLSRARRLVRLAAGGGYGPRRRGGLGPRALAKDVMSVLDAS